MPYAFPSWRTVPKYRVVSRVLCFFGVHHWIWSRTLAQPVACAVCPKKTKYYEEYLRRMDGGSERLKKDP